MKKLSTFLKHPVPMLPDILDFTTRRLKLLLGIKFQGYNVFLVKGKSGDF